MGGGRAGVRAQGRGEGWGLAQAGRDNKSLSEKVFYPTGKCGLLSSHFIFGGVRGGGHVQLGKKWIY